MRHLVIGADGTWNTPDQKDRGRQIPSNVVKMIRAVDENATEIEQLRYYNTGVGTSGALDKVRGGLAGRGLFTNMREACAWLFSQYRQDDRLFLFGFSRGAYTVRSLAGLLQLCGIPLSGDSNALSDEAARIYREQDGDERKKRADAFRKRHDCVEGRVHFLGVWDTVGALGLPVRGPLGQLARRRHGFHDVCLGGNVTHARHAVAINEERGPFEAALWKGEQPEGNESVLQAWFPGVHSNVGGGYVDAGLSDRALYWMIHHAGRCGLVFNPRYLTRRIDPNWFGELRDSLSLMYRTPVTGRPGPRRIGDEDVLAEQIHVSAVRRWQSPSRPEEMPQNLREALEHGVPVDESALEPGFCATGN